MRLGRANQLLSPEVHWTLISVLSDEYGLEMSLRLHSMMASIEMRLWSKAAVSCGSAHLLESKGVILLMWTLNSRLVTRSLSVTDEVPGAWLTSMTGPMSGLAVL